MDDARELQYGVGFETSDADSSIEQLTQKVDELEQSSGPSKWAHRSSAPEQFPPAQPPGTAAAFSDAADDAAAAAKRRQRNQRSGEDNATVRQRPGRRRR